MLFAPVLSALPVFAADQAPDARWATLQAIHCLENPMDRTAPGPRGELGAYQFRRSTWQLYTSKPFSLALKRSESDAIAIRHYDHIKANLEACGIEATPYNIALAWNGGLRAVLIGRPCRAARDYAERAANLAAAFEQRTAVIR